MSPAFRHGKHAHENTASKLPAFVPSAVGALTGGARIFLRMVEIGGDLTHRNEATCSNAQAGYRMLRAVRRSSCGAVSRSFRCNRDGGDGSCVGAIRRNTRRYLE